jgi:ribosome recycling factor
VRRDIHREMIEYKEEKLISEDDLERGEQELQKITDRYVEEIGKIGQRKDKEIMEV